MKRAIEQQMDAPTRIRIVRLPEVTARTGVSRSTIYQWMSKGTFPKSVVLGGRVAGWIEEEEDAWIHQQVAASRGVVQR